MQKFKSLFAVFLIVFATMSSAQAQVQTPYTYSNKNPSPNLPGGFCSTQTTPVFNYLTSVYWYCVPNSSAPGWTLGTWTSYTLPSGALAMNSLGQLSNLGVGGVSGTTFANVIQDTGPIPMTLSQLQTLNSVGFQVIAAKGAGTLIVPNSCTLDLIYGSAAFTGGGTVSIGYGTSSSPATNGTIASTVWTTFTASHAVTVLPVALAVTATASGLLNTGIYMTAASADFAAGTGATGVLDCSYRVISGLS